MSSPATTQRRSGELAFAAVISPENQRFPANASSPLRTSETGCVGRFQGALAVAFVTAILALAPQAWAGGVVSTPTEQALRAALVGGGTVTFTTTNTITLATPITISAATIINGNFANIGGGTNVGIFRIASNLTNLTLLNLTFHGGKATNGGALFIQTNATVVVSNCVFRYNQAVGRDGATGTDGANTTGMGGNGGDGGGGQPGLGGAICNQGRLTLLGCQFFTNSAFGGNGGAGGTGGSGEFQAGNGGAGGSAAAAYGGAVHNAGSLVASNCTFAANIAVGGNGGAGGAAGTGAFSGLPGNGGAAGGAGGAGVSSVADAVVVNCTFADNSGFGGDSAAAGQLANGNGANGAAGGDAAGAGLWISGTGAVTNCTFSANFVVGGSGGDGGAGDFIGGSGGRGGHGIGGSVYNAGALRFVNCTVADSGATGSTNGLGGTGLTPGAAGPFGESRGDNLANGSGTFTLKNSVIGYSAVSANAYGTFADAGHNLSSDATPALSHPRSQNNTDPLLGGLADNGGPTMTFVLYADSPCVNAGDDDACAPFDQRGSTRPSGIQCDIGAVELAAPAILIQPTNSVVIRGNTTTFTVSADSELPLLNYQWRFNGNDISGATGSSYTILTADATNAGLYSVVVDNFLGSVTSSNATLIVNVPPAFTIQPQSQPVLQGDSATWIAAATGTAPLSYQWRFNGANLSGATGTSYTRLNALAADAGAYSVVVTNVAGSITSSNALLTVNIPPAITSEPQSQTVNQNGQVTFTVTAAGTAPLSYQWRFNGNILSGATTTQYRLTNVQSASAGSYAVVVTNLFGAATSRVATLTVAFRSQLAQCSLPDGTNFAFTVSTRSGYRYSVEARTNLTDAGWTRLSTTDGTGGLLTNLVPLTGFPSRFFRVVEE